MMELAQAYPTQLSSVQTNFTKQAVQYLDELGGILCQQC